MASHPTGDEVSQPTPPTEASPSSYTPGRLLHRSFTHHPASVLSAKASTLFLSDGRSVLDACGGAAVATIGHGHPSVLDAISKQAHDVSYVHTQAFTTPAAEDLANLLLEGSPGGLDMAFFVGSGSEAVEAAMKLARQWHFERGETRRVHFVARQQGYHGNTMASMSLSSNVARKIPYQGFSYPHVTHVSPPFAYRYQGDAESEEDFTNRLVQEVEDEFLRVGTDNVIAFVGETVIGATAGCVTPPKGYWAGIQAVCQRYGILLILDEVMCGSGRCGAPFAFLQENVQPDIVTVAKGLGGGYAPIAGVLMNQKITDVIRNGSGAFVHGHTYQAHPLSCATALEVQKVIRREKLISQCAQMGKLLEELLRREIGGFKSVGDIRGRGLFWAVEFVQDKKTKSPFDPKIGFGVKVQQDAFERGVAVYPGAGTIDGHRGDHVLLAPPFNITQGELETVVEVLRESIVSQEALHG
ncbi:aminotransferase [Emericellopsis cladophorae]|uniref:Aminotransferase n=1 Tax=Emericellopsis cladophorae TaxID=2686198 RepID=A0A9P9XZ21_9HYPO|nr:aminotransferase [Emericellopsis cladophorae]KAI6780340.1 aminotransferase [Emericellopsis cladophorae]